MEPVLVRSVGARFTLVFTVFLVKSGQFSSKSVRKPLNYQFSVFFQVFTLFAEMSLVPGRAIIIDSGLHCIRLVMAQDPTNTGPGLPYTGPHIPVLGPPTGHPGYTPLHQLVPGRRNSTAAAGTRPE